ncbi:MAG: DUF499 domain-containing protein [Nitrospiraceae bacterium]|nr:DUF499 domain-containing protein [Nitrospiraceae bacterium]
MKSLQQLCVPRDSVFDIAKRDTVLNLTHLAGNKIDGPTFLEENYVTDGMRTLLIEAFRRLQGKSEKAVFKLTQAMGGGKTHNLIALGMLAKHPELRAHVLPELPKAKELPTVRVVAFSGRETDVPHGIWGEIARQIGKKDLFAPYYSPLQAPGRNAWTNLLKGAPTLILLDELPPYLDNAKAIAVGNSDLSRVTATALTNLFEAVAEKELGNVCVVLTDLVGTYAEASAQIATVLHQLQQEAQRHSMDLTPVQINTDEFYHILRKRLFKSLPKEQDIAQVAQGFAKAVREAKQMDITAQSPEQFAHLIHSSYPFHPAIKDLYARFRENPGFQQTRALIRLMRIIGARLWQSGEVGTKHLISVHDIDLNDPETLSEIRQINPTLDNAVSHDIASQGNAIAEVMDQNLGGTDTRDACRLIFMASLANVPNAVLGLSMPEIVAYLCAPGRNIARLKSDVLEKLATAAWYLHSNRDAKLFFKNTQNLVAKLESLSGAYVREQAVKELRERLTNLFKPVTSWCYQDVLPLPAIDEIQLTLDRITLVISEPYVGQGLNPELVRFFEQTTFKNRVAFLTGSRNTFDTLIASAKRLRAIQQILEEMATDRVPESDPQFKQADELRDRLLGQFLSAVKETFSTLHYPTRQGDKDVLFSADFLMKFEGNKYNGEEQIIQILKEKQKYTEDITSDTFRRKIEARLFTTPTMLWTEVKRRAAMNPQWQWHRRDALDALKEDLVHKEVWRQDAGGYVDRTPPPPRTTSVQIQERSRNDDTGEVELRVTPIYGDIVYAEIAGEATTASKKVENAIFVTSEMEVSFLAVDSTAVHPTGPPYTWKNRVTLKYRLYTGNNAQRMLELQAAPNKDRKAIIRYTTDGSDPKLVGGKYETPVAIPRGTQVILAYAERDGIVSERLEIPLRWDRPDVEKPIDPAKPLVWRHRHEFHTTLESYAFFERLNTHQTSVTGVKISVTGEQWAELTLHERIKLDAAQLREAAEAVRKLPNGGQLGVEVAAFHFERGQQFLDWINEVKGEFKPTEVHQ